MDKSKGEIAKMFGLNRRSALAMMTRIQRKVPRIFFDHDSYTWVYDGETVNYSP